MKSLLGNYGIEINSWFDDDKLEHRRIIHRPFNSMDEEEKEEKIKLEEEKKEKRRRKRK